jgi:GNAT superfamily N-acetyltransferase
VTPPEGEIALRPARADDLAAATALCLHSKAHWGHDAAFMAACAPELTLSADDLGPDLMVAMAGGSMVGVVQIEMVLPDCHLEKLFVDPARMGAGIGRALFDWAAAQGRARQARALVIIADPGAVPFYERMGCLARGTEASGSIPARRLPRLGLDLGARP